MGDDGKRVRKNRGLSRKKEENQERKTEIKRGGDTENLCVYDREGERERERERREEECC